MNNNLLLRWKQPFIILIIGLGSIFLMQYFIKVSLFQYGLYNRVNLKNKANEPDTMVFDSGIDALVPTFYLSDNEGVALSTGIEKLIPKLTFTCSKHDIKEMRLANDL
ncbi:hypothetical protein [Photobacterium sp. GB-36]|nr:hypothetical protein [Photobacterium sp. GB-36]